MIIIITVVKSIKNNSLVAKLINSEGLFVFYAVQHVQSNAVQHVQFHGYVLAFVQEF